MAIEKVIPSNGGSQPAPLDASKLVVTLSKNLAQLPDYDNLHFGQVKTDHMLIVTHDPVTGWSTPEIKPYGPLSLDPASSCFQYCPNIFEGMKAYIGPDGEPRLFRPEKNMERFARSAARVALPPFDTDALLVLIKQLIKVEARWIPKIPGHSLYIRPTMIGTRSALGVAASEHAIIYVILTPAGPYFHGEAKGIPLLAVGKSVRAWPGGTGGHKLGLNYAPGFLPQREAAQQGYSQILWLLGEDSKVTEAGAMNFFAVVKRDDGDLDVFTPPLDGTILPGVTRMSCLDLLDAHTSNKTVLPGIPATQRLHASERIITMHDITLWASQGRLFEAFGVGTAVIVAPIGKIGFEGKDIVVPGSQNGLGLVGKALWQRLTDIQTGVHPWSDWSVTCD